MMSNLVRQVLTGKIEFVRAALTAGANVNESEKKDGRTAIMYATDDGYLPIAALLLESGADPNLHDKAGWTALHFAAQECALDIVRLLLQHGALVDPCDEHGNTPLMKAVFNSRGRGEVITELLKSGADRNVMNKHGISPAMLAKSISNYDVEKFLK